MNNIRTVSRAADHIAEIMRGALERHGTCIVGLSGGNTPKVVYEKLRDVFCQAPHPPPVPVRSGFGRAGRTGYVRAGSPLPMGEGTLRFFLVDERYVPPNHPESNQRLVRETLLKACHAEPVEAPDTSLPLDDCVADYARRLKALWKDRLPDLVILGMGTDGHIASLFPPLTNLALGDECLVLHTHAPEGVGPPAARDRITLSLNALCAAEHRLLLLGPEKERTWEMIMASNDDERRWPLKRIMETGRLTVFTQPPAPPW